VTGLVDRLVERGLVVRSEDGQDRRTIRVRGTGDGEVLIKGLVASRREQLARILAAVPEEQRAAVRGAFRALLEAVQAQACAPGEDRASLGGGQ
jgi:DNA-binding MarR family transcriptional regulator